MIEIRLFWLLINVRKCSFLSQNVFCVIFSLDQPLKVWLKRQSIHPNLTFQLSPCPRLHVLRTCTLKFSLTLVDFSWFRILGLKKMLCEIWVCSASCHSLLSLSPRLWKACMDNEVKKLQNYVECKKFPWGKHNRNENDKFTFT